MVNTPGVGDHAAEPDETDAAVSVRPSPVIEAANKARNVYASLGGLLTLASGVGLITAQQVGALDLTVGIILAAVPVVVTVGTQLLAAARTIAEAWSKVTPVDSPRKVVDGQLVPLVPAFDPGTPGAPVRPAGL